MVRILETFGVDYPSHCSLSIIILDVRCPNFLGGQRRKPVRSSESRSARAPAWLSVDEDAIFPQGLLGGPSHSAQEACGRGARRGTADRGLPSAP